MIATNRVLSGARAFVDSSTVGSTGDVAVTATNLSVIDALTFAATSTGNQAVGVLLAFNTIGWNPSNLLFAAVDALLGDPLISEAFNGENPAETLAYITNTTLTVGGNLTVTALTAAQITAVVSNEATSAPAAVFGASGMSAAFVLASNMVSAVARAYLENETVAVTGDVSVTADDEASISADTNLRAEVSPTNDALGGDPQHVGRHGHGPVRLHEQHRQRGTRVRKHGARRRRLRAALRCCSTRTTTRPGASTSGWARPTRATSPPRTTRITSTGRRSRRPA